MSTPTTIFIGGSRSITLLHTGVVGRLSRIMEAGYQVVVGDADGVDAAVQNHLAEASYPNVTVFYSGSRPRNHLGQRAIHHVPVPPAASGYQFHAAKDRAMAQDAGLGLMIWDGASPGTALNGLRLTGQGKSVIMTDGRDGKSLRLDTVGDWSHFIALHPSRLRTALRARATPAEWAMTT